MNPYEIAAGIKPYFNKAKHSDVRIKLDGGEVMSAHKLILCQGSSRFRELLEHEDKSELELHGSPAAVKGVVAFLYGLDYDGASTFGPPPSILEDCTRGGGSYAHYQVELYVLAAQFQIPSLQTRITRFFEFVVESVSRGDGYPKELDTLIRQVYITHRAGAAHLRTYVVSRLAALLPRIQNESSLETLMNDIPSLGYELLKATLAPPTEPKSISSDNPFASCLGTQQTAQDSTSGSGPFDNRPASGAFVGFGGHVQAASTTSGLFGTGSTVTTAAPIAGAMVKREENDVVPRFNVPPSVFSTTSTQPKTSSPAIPTTATRNQNGLFGSGSSTIGSGIQPPKRQGNLFSNSSFVASPAAGQKRKASEIEQSPSFASTAPATVGEASQQSSAPRVKLPRTGGPFKS